MTVDQLIEKLKALPGNTLVVMSSDTEGNTFSPMCEISSGFYDRDTSWSGTFYEFNEEGNDEEIGGDMAVCLWPSN